MGYPVWQTKSGDLGKISSQEFFNLVLSASDPDNNGSIEYKLVAGQLPKGLQVDPTGYLSGNPETVYTLEGVPFSTNVDVDSLFTIRATNTYDNKITDRTFKITVTGNFKPTITTTNDLLGTFLDGTEINLQLNAIDLNNDTLSWNVISGSLPPGLTLDSNGLISGIIKPAVYSFSNQVVGWSESKWNTLGWEFTTISGKQSYSFTVAVNDTKSQSLKTYRIDVFAFNDMRADTVAITADSNRSTTDIIPVRPTILTTKTLGNFSTINSGGYYAFKFDAVNYDITQITYELTTALGLGWDSDVTNPIDSLSSDDIVSGEGWDIGIWDKADLTLPPGLHLDPNTGWMTGYIPLQAETTKDYVFGISVYSNNDNTTKSTVRLFTLTVLGDLDLAVDWSTPSNLGSVYVGSTSNLAVEAFAASGRDLTYSMKNGSKLPQGLKLLNDGTISGKVSFQTMGFDQGKTTFDKTLNSKFVYTNDTNFDNVYKFTVVANDYANQISGERTFTLRVIASTYEPYENLYIKCMPSVDNRMAIAEILNNTDIIDPMDVYRPNDPYYGVSSDIKFLVNYGIKPSKMSDYIAAMKDRHFMKKFYFGDYKVAQGKDTNGNILYDVLYVEMIEDTKIYYNDKGVTRNKVPASFTNINNTKANWRNPRARTLSENQLFSDTTKVDQTINYIKTNDTFFPFEPLNVISPNDLTLMQNDIAMNLENTYLNSLPEWMVSVQSNGKIIGYIAGAALAYLKPNTGAKTLFNMRRFAPSDIKNIPFVADRYILDNNYSQNFDLDVRRFSRQKYTTFNLFLLSNYNITPVFKADFAVNRPFDSINGHTLDYIVSSGGLDGITYNLDGKYLIFATQEFFTEWGYLINDGWNNNILNNYVWDDDTLNWDQDVWDKYISTNSVLPGYQEKTNTPTLPNKRGGVWQIKISADNIINLIFVTEINPGDYVYIKEGATHGDSYQLYDISALDLGFTVPNYTQTNSNAHLPTNLDKPTTTTFDKKTTQFINNVDTYTLPLQGDKYLQFPKIGVFTNGQ
jgi:hypothetical protein